MSEDASSSASTAESRPAVYPFLEYHAALEKAVLKLSGRPRHCAINAIRSLRRAWLVAPIDPELAAFRAITAEEEAATALMAALKQRRYPRSNELSWRRHDHKAGIYPFLRAVESLIAESGVPTPNLRLNFEADVPHFEIQFTGESLGLPHDLHVTPDAPLNMTISQGGDSEGKSLVNFAGQLQALADGRGARDIKDYIEKEANLRNLLLYAGDDGVPHVQEIDSFLISRRKPVTLLVSLAITILQTKETQLFAVQTVNAYLEALGKGADSDFDYGANIEPPASFAIKVQGGPDQMPVATLEKRFIYEQPSTSEAKG